MRLVFASTNAGKLRECALILAPQGITVLPPPQRLDVEETGQTFAANALLKAQAHCSQVGAAVLADDSGLEVTALNGAPGVHSARYWQQDGGPLVAADGSVDARNRRKLLAALQAVPAGRRQARLVCALVLCRPGAAPVTFEGTVAGEIATAAAGTGGFGYDPLFIPQGQTQTFAQLPAAIKQASSHRAAALAQLVAYLRTC